MSFLNLREQIEKLKQNWIFIIIIILFLILFFGKSFFAGLTTRYESSSVLSSVLPEISRYQNGYPNYENSGYFVQDDFAPEEKDRKITKQAEITSEVEKGEFKDAESQLKNRLNLTNSILISQNINQYNEGKKSYYVGFFLIKVPGPKYESLISDLKHVGEIIHFTESQDDITSSFQNLQIEIQSENSRLLRYKSLYDETKDIDQKIILTDKIFEQERKIKYLEDSLKNANNRVEYSTVSLTINEKRGDYADMMLIKFSELIKGLLSSLNNLLKLVFVIIPWVVLFIIALFLYKLVRRKKRKK